MARGGPGDDDRSVRAQSPEDDGLEALSVCVDGVEHRPEPAAHDAPAYVMPDAQEVIDALRATIAEGPLVLALPPWSYDRPSTVPLPRPASFNRMIPLPARSLELLADWWERRARHDRVEVAGRLVLEEPCRGESGVWRVRGRLRSRTHTRWIPVEVWLWPRLDAWTRLNVEPQRGVRISRRYFASGHRVLDLWCRDLVRDLVAR